MYIFRQYVLYVISSFSPQDVHILIVEAFEYIAYMAKGSFSDMIKNIEMGWYFWIIWIGLMKSQGSL